MSAEGFVGAVLAGGSSSRMGRDKALIEIDGAPLVTRAIEALRGAGASPVLVVGGDPVLAELADAQLADDQPGAGPLAALVQVMGRHSGELVVMLSCDIPLASAVEVCRVVEAAVPDRDVAVPVVDGQRQWLHAAWRPEALPALAEALATGERAVHRAARSLRIAEVAPEDPRSLSDVDGPEDLDRYSRGDS